MVTREISKSLDIKELDSTEPGLHGGKVDKETKRIYLVGASSTSFEEQDFKFVMAPSPAEAEFKYVRQVIIQENLFLEHVYGKSMNASFAETFWLQTEEEYAQLEQGNGSELTDEQLEARIREWFGQRTDFADLYVAFYFGDDEITAPTQFPEEMLLYIWDNTDWTELTVVSIDDIPTI